ncbi:PIN domain-containing protein [Desulfurobacterium sp.]
MNIQRLIGVFFIFLLLVSTLIFRNYGFTATQSMFIGILITAAAVLLYTFVFHQKKFKIRGLLIFSAGFFLGLYLAKGITISLYAVFTNFPYLQEILYLTLPYLFGFAFLEMVGEKPLSEIWKGETGLYATVKVLDTSALIDGRIVEVIKLGFVEGKIVIPRFVLEELQYLSDSTDPTVRTKGKKGLEQVSLLKGIKNPPVEIYERDFPRIKEVDAKLVELCRLLKAKLITTDYNLNKVASIKGVEILNVNDLANALKPVVAVGEELVVFVMKEGKEREQGVGYLDDGTMVVVDGGRSYIGHRIKATVNNVLQTSSGKIIFVKPKEVIK